MTLTRADRPTLVLVDAFSTGALLARAAAEEHRVVHVRSRPQMPDAFVASLPSDLFAADLTWSDGTAGVLERLARERPVAVLAGSEFGVEVADEAAAHLGLRGNDRALSGARRDKAQMMDAVSAAGLRVPAQCRSDDLAELIHWRELNGLAEVVVKPLDSAGSEAVYLCGTQEEVRAAFDAVLGRTNLMMRVNEAALIQEYLTGDEYVINTVSRDGVHWVTDAWLSGKIVRDRGRKLYDYEDLLPASDPDPDGIFGYVRAVLDALAITDGPAHTELILTAGGPCLLETGARISGLANPPALDRSTGDNQVRLALDAYSGRAERLRSRPLDYRRRESARCVNLIAHRQLPFPAARIQAVLEALPAFQSYRFRVAEGALTRRTVDLNSSPGVVFLVHPDPAQIERGYQVIRALERELL